MSIFVSIASYCDPVLGFTLARARATASAPRQLHFGVVDQSSAAAAPPSAAELQPCRLSHVRIEPVYARGPCWARALAMSLYEGEDWFLQIDSHMDFDPGWDERLVAQARALLPGRRGVVLSSYPNPFVFDQGQPARRPATDKVLAHVVKPGGHFEPEHPVLGFEAHPVHVDQPVPGFHVGAGCLFAPGRFVEAFPYDPWFYFHGEEQGIAIRLFTHGWDIFHMPGLPLYHLYNNAEAGGPPRPMHWDAAHEAQRQRSWWSLEQRSRARLTALVDGSALGVFGLGGVRTMADYAAFSGIDYRARVLAPQAFRPLLPQPQPA
ncbi:GlcNAc-transferase family protein [Ramlibacter sp.]|uniref:GlcNAc-transferase family protein n=1 Tax=Ramlibacter sp. TaxID=1917967 RepID=UPI002C7AA113|nr:GlcNAc-transferase family protein [Ramlibacter sp.]HWI82805.1 GlcNAc-transferase family protein [Ramlibacter sp.]